MRAASLASAQIQFMGAKKAERVGFEPTSRQAHYPFSRRVPSTAQAPLRLDGNASMTLEVNLVNEHFL